VGLHEAFPFDNRERPFVFTAVVSPYPIPLLLGERGGDGLGIYFANLGETK
jgi:hypothetical protein